MMALVGPFNTLALGSYSLRALETESIGYLYLECDLS